MLAEAGLDLIALEILRDVEQATYAVETAAATDSLPGPASVVSGARMERSYSGLRRTPSRKLWRRYRSRIHQ